MKEIAGVKMFDTADVSKQLGVSEQTVRAYFVQGKLKGRKIARKWHATQEALEEYLRATEQPQGA